MRPRLARLLLSVGLAAAAGCAGKHEVPSALVEVGTAMPDVTAVNQDGRPVRLAELRGKPLVLWFYPADFTSG